MHPDETEDLMTAVNRMNLGPGPGFLGPVVVALATIPLIMYFLGALEIRLVGVVALFIAAGWGCSLIFISLSNRRYRLYHSTRNHGMRRK